MKVEREMLIGSVTERMGSLIRSIYASQEFQFGKTKVGGQYIRILFFLVRNKEGVSVKQLAETLHVTSGAVTQFIDALVSKRLVTRGEDSVDRRMHRLRLSESAIRDFGDFQRLYNEIVNRAFAPLDDEELRKLAALLNETDVAR